MLPAGDHLHLHQQPRTLVCQSHRHLPLVAPCRYRLRLHILTPIRPVLSRITHGLAMVPWRNLSQQGMVKGVQPRLRLLAPPLERGKISEDMNNSIIRTHRGAASLHHYATAADTLSHHIPVHWIRGTHLLCASPSIIVPIPPMPHRLMSIFMERFITINLGLPSFPELSCSTVDLVLFDSSSVCHNRLGRNTSRRFALEVPRS
jgi:hypothetical protein